MGAFPDGWHWFLLTHWAVGWRWCCLLLLLGPLLTISQLALSWLFLAQWGGKVRLARGRGRAEAVRIAPRHQPDRVRLGGQRQWLSLRNNLFLFLFCATGVWTQGFTLAQVLYHLSHASSSWGITWKWHKIDHNTTPSPPHPPLPPGLSVVTPFGNWYYQFHYYCFCHFYSDS
jgi:hypothetical protein